MRVLNSVVALREQLGEERSQGRRSALVPTMGFLHEGHLSLVDRARQLADLVVMSIFVNPLQFGPREDLAAYPRDLERDLALAAERGVDVVFAPSAEEMYPTNPPQVTIHAPRLSDRLCGRFRPGHFEGVLTVVAKLFNVIEPDIAVFGQKDFQQSVLIRRMCQDLNMPVQIEVAPIVREADGLALSSRNVYLSPEERRAAPTLHRALRAAQSLVAQGETDAGRVRAAAHEVLAAEPLIQTQYLELVDPLALDDVQQVRPGDVLALAAFLGRTRLIDNTVLG
jgi:pantoate--beta-alanine ligase